MRKILEGGITRAGKKKLKCMNKVNLVVLKKSISGLLSKLISGGIVFLIFFVPFQTRYIYRTAFINGNFWEYGSKSIYASELLIWFLILLVIISFVFNNSKPFSCLLQKIKIFSRLKFFWLIASSALVFFSLVHSFDPSLSLHFLLHFLTTLFGALVLVYSGISFIKASSLWWASGILQSILALVQFLSQHVLPNKWLGMAEHLPSHFGAAVIETTSGRWLRAYGGLGWPNTLGIYLASAWILGLVILVYFINAKQVLSRRKFWWHLFFVLGQMVIFSGLVVSFSRAAWLSSLIGFVVLGFIVYKQKNADEDKKNQFRILIRNFLYALVVFLTFFIIFKPLFTTRFSDNTRLESRSISERVGQYGEALNVIKTHFWWGVGFGSYTAYNHKIDPARPVWENQPVHNAYVLFLAETGLFVFVFVFGSLIFVVYKTLKTKIFFVPVVVTLLVNCFFDHSVWSLYGGQLFFVLILSLGFLL